MTVPLPGPPLRPPAALMVTLLLRSMLLRVLVTMLRLLVMLRVRLLRRWT